MNWELSYSKRLSDAFPSGHPVCALSALSVLTKSANNAQLNVLLSDNIN